MVHHGTGVVDMNDVLLLHGSIVTTAIAIDDRTAFDFEIGPVKLGEYLTLVGNNLCNRCGMVIPIIDSVCHLTITWSWCLFIVKITITTGKELSDINFLGIISRLDVSSALAISRILRIC